MLDSPLTLIGKYYKWTALYTRFLGTFYQIFSFTQLFHVWSLENKISEIVGLHLLQQPWNVGDNTSWTLEIVCREISKQSIKWGCGDEISVAIFYIIFCRDRWTFVCHLQRHRRKGCVFPTTKSFQCFTCNLERCTMWLNFEQRHDSFKNKTKKCFCPAKTFAI